VQNSPGLTTVVQTVINLSSTQTINATASVEAISSLGPSDNVGCRLVMDNLGPMGLDNVITIPGAGGAASISNVGSAANVPKGQHTISLNCYQTSGPSGDAVVGNDNLLAWTTG
jgi:UDP-N-acetylenolpyruvoylglucosamine reductase